MNAFLINSVTLLEKLLFCSLKSPFTIILHFFFKRKKELIEFVEFC